MAYPLNLPFVQGERACIALIAALFACVVLIKAWGGGITVDEPSHLLSASIYWRGGYTLPPRDMPPLIRIVGGWATRIWPLPIPADLGKKGDERQEWIESIIMAEKLPNHDAVHRAFFPARASLIIFPLGILLLVWWWGRQLFDPWTGVATAAFLALDPTFRGHSGLFKNDLAAAFGYVLFWFAAWNYWRGPSRRNGFLLAAAATVGLLAKLSMIVLIPIALIVVAMRANAKSAATSALACILVPWAISIAVAPHEAERISARDIDHIGVQYRNQVPGFVPAAGRVFQIVPVSRPLWEGVISLILNNSAESPNYFLGELAAKGSPWYFALAFAVKWPLPLLAVFVFGTIAIVSNRPDAETLAFILTRRSRNQIGLQFQKVGASCEVRPKAHGY